MNSRAPVGRRVAIGAMLSFLGMVVIRFIGIAGLAVLGRLLTPDAFGLMAMAMIVVGLVDAITNRQFDMALIRQAERTDAHFDTAFTLACTLGVLSSAGVALAAAPVAGWFGEPALRPILYCLALGPLLVGLQNPYFLAREIALDFRPRVFRTIASRLASTLVAAVVAVATRDVWALVAGYLAMQATMTAATWIAAGSKRPRVGLVHGRAAFAFGGWLTLAGVADFLAKRVPVTLLGRVAGAELAGVFQMASEIAVTMTAQLLTPVTNSIFPGLSSMAADRARLRQAYLLAQEGMIALALPLGVGMALVAPELVRVMLGAQWAAVVPVIQILAPAAVVLALVQGAGMAAMIDGKTRLLFLRKLLRLVVSVPATFAGWHYGGAEGVAIAMLGTLVLDLALNLALAARLTGTTFAAPLLVAWRAIVATLAMATAVSGLDLAIGRTGFDLPVSQAALSLVAKTAAGAVTFGSVLIGLWIAAGRPDGIERRGMEMMRRRFGGGRKGTRK